ncbi:MAG: putative RDD family membrane protein YckC [Alphaproteobacteria bacterium]|jgi:uncharacterized RDD family membrane protein YckC
MIYARKLQSTERNMENNVYQAPESELNNNDPQNAELAGRWARLGASLIDTIIMLIILIPIMLLSVGFTEERSFVGELVVNLIFGILGVVIFFLINGKLLFSSGQTIGKKMLGLGIISRETSQVPSKNVLIKRYGLYFGLGYVPVIGGILSLVNVCFIFGHDKTCLHDRFADTVVIIK